MNELSRRLMNESAVDFELNTSVGAKLRVHKQEKCDQPFSHPPTGFNEHNVRFKNRTIDCRDFTTIKVRARGDYHTRTKKQVLHVSTDFGVTLRGHVDNSPTSSCSTSTGTS